MTFTVHLPSCAIGFILGFVFCVLLGIVISAWEEGSNDEVGK